MKIRLRGALVVASVAAAAVAVAVVLAPSADAAITSSALTNPVSGKCLDVTGASNANGAQVEIWTCHNAANQLWTSTAAGELRVTIGGVTKCLDAYNNQTTNGTKIEIWSCSGGANQKWNLNSNSTITGVQSGKCLDINNNGTGDGGPVRPPVTTTSGGSPAAAPRHRLRAPGWPRRTSTSAGVTPRPRRR
jgi:hypothetical protein